MKSTLGDLSITEKQADKLGCGSGSRLSPHLENCCLRLSANVEYNSAAKDIGICSIGSGAVESGIKQIARRVKISGASWESEHVGQVLAHRCAYLNGLIGKPRKAA